MRLAAVGEAVNANCAVSARTTPTRIITSLLRPGEVAVAYLCVSLCAGDENSGATGTHNDRGLLAQASSRPGVHIPGRLRETSKKIGRSGFSLGALACSTADVCRSRSRRLARTRRAQAANGGPLPDARSLPIARDNRFSHRCRPRRPRKTTPGFVTSTGSQRMAPHAICAIEPMMLQTSKRSATVVHSHWEMRQCSGSHRGMSRLSFQVANIVGFYS